MNTTDKIMAHVQHACATFKPSSLRVHDDVMASLREAIEVLVRDAERLDYLQKNARCDPKMDGKHVWWPMTFNQAQKLKGATLREAIDTAMQEKQS